MFEMNSYTVFYDFTGYFCRKKLYLTIYDVRGCVTEIHEVAIMALILNEGSNLIQTPSISQNF